MMKYPKIIFISFAVFLLNAGMFTFCGIDNYNDEHPVEESINLSHFSKEDNVNIQCENGPEIYATRGSLKEKVMVKWKAIKGAKYYKVYRSKNFNGLYTCKSGKTTDLHWFDTEAEVGIYYWYKVIPFYKLHIGKPTKKVQGWGKPVQASQSAHESGPTEILINALSRIPHWLRVGSLSKKYQASMTDAMNIDEFIPESDDIYDYVEKVCKTPHRRLGTLEGKIAEDYIIEQLKKIMEPEYEVKTDPIDVFVYQVDAYGLEIAVNGKKIDYNCFYAANTGINEVKPNGGTVEGQMVWAGEGTDEDFKDLVDLYGNLNDKIVVIDCPIPKLPTGLLEILFKNAYYISDPDNTVEPGDKLPMTAMLPNLPHEFEGEPNHKGSAYWKAYENGAEALIVILKDYPADINKHWGPYGTRLLAEMPALYVDNYSREEIMDFANNGNRARVTIEGTVTPGQARNIYVKMPGESKETIFVTTHHDAAFKGATEDGTGVAMVLAMAKAWKEASKKQVLPKSILFHLSAGHFFGGKGAEEFAKLHKDDLLKDAIININLEHLAARKVKEDIDHNMVIDGDRGASEFILVTEDLAAISAVRRMLQKYKPKNTMCLPGNFLGPVPPGESGHYHLVLGIEYIHYIGAPQYLLTAEDTLDKVDIPQLNPVAKGVSELIGSFMMLAEGADSYDDFQ